MRQIVPFSLEDSLADDVEGLMFAVGARIGATAAAVAVVSKARLEGWLAELSAAGIVPQAVYSETDGVPDVPATVMLMLEGERVYARRPGQPPFVLEGVPLRQVVDLLRGGGAEELKHAIAYADPETRAHLQTRFAGSRMTSRPPRRRSPSTVCSRTSLRRSRSGPRRICSRAPTRRSRIGWSSLNRGATRPRLLVRGRVARRSRCKAPNTGAAPRGQGSAATARCHLPAARRHEGRTARATPRSRSACMRGAARAPRRFSRRSRRSPRCATPRCESMR